jgi:hypothetical protein
MKSYTEKNIAAAFEYSQKLAGRISKTSGEYRAQWKAFNEQTKNLGDAMTKGAIGWLKDLSS